MWGDILSSEFNKFITSDVYDLAVATGITASNRGVKRTQIENIIGIFESESDPTSAVKITIAFVARQVGRKRRGEREGLDPSVGFKIIDDLKNILNKFKGNELRVAARRYLYLVKWFFESGVKGKIQNFSSFVDQFLSHYKR